MKGVVVGDPIRLVLPANGLLKLAYLAYVQPLLLAMALATLVAQVAPAQVGAQVVALLVGLGCGAVWSLTRTSVRQAIAGMLEISESSHRK
jgi:positive regulator of sigma E activity